ncbi:hypothetical protein XBI1_420004 [Xenorhabdus bovienii str. Intermedium]|uniref:Uncharacterized protein n=1 Tax=Xenorhabdus bovienii str. Intermedium TaxID=1379677 RepID=A0A077QMY3_XENBV|nr:hypothetical protein XBI1_420004 [Xenorhabdus bovienii str. Intermedium]
MKNTGQSHANLALVSTFFQIWLLAQQKLKLFQEDAYPLPLPWP